MKQALLTSLFFVTMCMGMRDNVGPRIPIEMRHTKSESSIVLQPRHISPRMKLLKTESSEKLRAQEHEGEKRMIINMIENGLPNKSQGPRRLSLMNNSLHSKSCGAEAFVKIK